MGKPFAVYPASVYDAFRFAPYVAAGGFLFSILAAALSTAPKGSNEDEDIYDPGSKWADDDTAKRDKLINAKCGPIIGGFERTMGKVVRCGILVNSGLVMLNLPEVGNRRS